MTREGCDANREGVARIDPARRLDLLDSLRDDPGGIDHHRERDGDLQRNQDRAGAIAAQRREYGSDIQAHHVLMLR